MYYLCRGLLSLRRVELYGNHIGNDGASELHRMNQPESVGLSINEIADGCSSLFLMNKPCLLGLRNNKM